MADTDDLLAADAARRAAMVAGDAEALAVYLADDLTWTHSSGKTDDKATFLEVLAAGTTVYHSLDSRDTLVRQFDNLFILEGVVFGDVTKDGNDKALVNRFITVWEKQGDGGFVLHAWQSTGLT